MDTPTDLSLTVALAEYAELSELRRRADQGSGARFNYFIAVATAGAAVASALLASAQRDPATQLSAAGAIGAILILLGIVSFVRMVKYRLSRAEYTAALAALRRYLMHRAPDVAPFIVLPTDDYSVRPKRGPLAKPSWVDLAMTVGYINSAIFAGAMGWGLWWSGQPLSTCLAAGGITFVGAVVLHRAYELLQFQSTFRRIQEQISNRLVQPASSTVPVTDP